MKVLFVMKYPLVDSYSIMQKLNGEINAVRNLGHEPFFISFDREYMYLDNGSERKTICKTRLGHFPGYFHTIVFYDLYKNARKVILENNFDMVYFRHSPLNYYGYRMIKAASKKSKLLVEISSFPPYTEKSKNTIRAIYQLMSQKWWNRSAKYVDLFTGIGEYADEYLGRPFLNIDNGIDVDLIPPREHIDNEDGKIHLLAVASMCEWHGYERIIQGLAKWDREKARHYVVDFVGDDGDGSLQKWKELSQKAGLSEQIIFHGRLTGNSLTDMYNKVTIGICSLALYKIGFQSGSVLKLREYMARGLPFIYAHDDPHMNEGMPWCMRISNDDSPVDMEKVESFVKGVMTKSTLADEMREYATKNMSWEKQFEKVFHWLMTNDKQQ